MEDLMVIVYTMKGCPFCSDFKDMLNKESIEFYERDIDEYKEEYDTYVEVTDNEFIPSLLILEKNGKDYDPYLYAPDRDYEELTDAINIINSHRKKFGLI